MSTGEDVGDRARGPRAELIERLAEAGRELSDAAVMYHTALGSRLGLGPSDWKMLGLLERRGAQTAGELSERTGLAPASITGIVDRLEAGGWVRRSRDPRDRRRVVVELDVQGVEDMRDLFAGLARRLETLYARYDDRELELVQEFMREAARLQREATAELAGESDEPSGGSG